MTLIWLFSSSPLQISSLCSPPQGKTAYYFPSPTTCWATACHLHARQLPILLPYSSGRRCPSVPSMFHGTAALPAPPSASRAAMLPFTRQWETTMDFYGNLKTGWGTSCTSPASHPTPQCSAGLKIPKNKHHLCHIQCLLTMQSFPRFLSCLAIPTKMNSYEITEYHF